LYRFGPFELDVDRAELRREGQVVHLRPQPFKALELFVSRAGELVTRDELRRALWADDNFVDFNAGVNFCIAKLRLALDDPASRSAYLVAVPRRGYKFVAALERTGEGATSAPVRKNRTPWAGAAATLVIAAGAWFALSKSGGATATLEARHYYEMGALALADAAPAELRARVGYFERAIELHPALADAFIGLSEARMILGTYRAQTPPSAYAAAKAAAEHAIALAPESADAHAVLGAALLYHDWNWEQAELHLSRALALDHSSARAQTWMSRYLSARGRHDEAIVHAREAERRQPGSASAKTAVGMALFYAGRLPEAVAACESATALMNQFIPAWSCAMNAAAENGDLPRTLRFWKGLAAAAGSSTTAVEAAQSNPAFAMADFWRGRLERIERSITDGDPDRAAIGAAVVAAHSGNRDRALTWLERGVERRTDLAIYANVHPAFAGLHGDPRFAAVLERIGLRR
jgi:DNA-binding winged helix-turn-helix (wHTH) protein